MMRSFPGFTNAECLVNRLSEDRLCRHTFSPHDKLKTTIHPENKGSEKAWESGGRICKASGLIVQSFGKAEKIEGRRIGTAIPPFLSQIVLLLA
jgi:hypothetical protein